MARNDSVANVTQAEDKKVASPFSADEAKASDVVRFWSTQSGYTIAVTPGKNVSFKNHVLVLGSDDPSVKKIRGLKSSSVKEVLDKPFEDETALSRFNKLLQRMVFNQDSGKVSRRGKVALLGLFSAKDGVDVMGEADELIMRALKTKSFKEGI